MPSVNPGESKDDYIKRCMAYPETNDKYPDSKQRYAVCNGLWSEHLKKKAKSWLHPESKNDEKN